MLELTTRERLNHMQNRKRQARQISLLSTMMDMHGIKYDKGAVADLETKTADENLKELPILITDMIRNNSNIVTTDLIRKMNAAVRTCAFRKD